MAKTLTAWAEQHTGVVTWLRAIGTVVAMVAAGAMAWAVLMSRVEAAEATLQSHGAQLREHADAIGGLRQGHRDLAWNIFVVCTLQAQQLGISADSCRRPVER